MEALLRHEERYWVTSAAARRLHLDLPVLRQAVTVACLITVKGKKSACEMLRCIPELKDSPGKCRKTADWLHDLYPPGAAEGLGSPGWIGPLRPGLIAERLVTSTMEAEPDLLRCLLRKASEKQAYHALTTLARAAATWPTADELVRIGLSTSFGTLAVPAVRAMVATRTQLAGTIAALLARRPQLLADTLSRMLDQIPESSSDLAELRLAVLRRLCDATPDGTQARAAMLARLSDRLATDQPGEAADLARKVTIIYRRLAEQDPGQYQPALRNSLIELGARLEAAGRVDEAKEVRNEVAEIDRRRISVQGLLDRGGRSTGSSAEEAGSKGTHPKGPDPREPARAHSRPGASSRRHRRRIGREHPRRAAN